MDSIFGLYGKTVLITGASSGIGRSIAVQCSRQGATILLTARNKDRLSETREMLSPGDHRILPVDLTEEKEISDLSRELPTLDGIVLNAGIVRTLPVKYIKKETVDLMFNTNINSSIFLVHKIIRQKKISSGGSICFISSVSSNVAQVGNSVYSATKGAVNSFARALALELAPKNIRVNGILPGYVDTDILNSSPIDQEQLMKHKKNFPLGRFGKPEDIAFLTVYLLSAASEWMTGSLITIDGGYSIQ